MTGSASFHPFRAARRAACLWLIAAATTALAQPGGLDGPTSRGGISGLQTVQIIDRNGFEQPMPAATMLVPTGWQTEGGIRWQPQATCLADGTQVAFVARAPNGRSAIELIPGSGWSSASGTGCPARPIGSARQYLETLARLIRPAPSIEGYHDRPDLIGGASHSVQRQHGFQFERRVSAGQLLIAYEQGGTRVQEIMIGRVEIQSTRMPDMPTAGETIDGEAGPVFSMRAPHGLLDHVIAERVQRSFRYEQPWMARMNEHRRAMQAQSDEGAARRSEISRRTAEEIRRSSQESWERRNKETDRGHRRLIDVIRGEEPRRRRGRDDDDD